jgi:hypothetical protein
MRRTFAVLLFTACAVAQSGSKPKLTDSYAKAALKALIAVRNISVLESTSPESPDRQRASDALADAEVEATSKSDKESFDKLKLFIAIHDLRLETCRSEQETDRAMRNMSIAAGKIPDMKEVDIQVQKAFDDSGMTRDYKCIDAWKDALRARDPKAPAICEDAGNSDGKQPKQ